MSKKTKSKSYYSVENDVSGYVVYRWPLFKAASRPFSTWRGANKKRKQLEEGKKGNG